MSQRHKLAIAYVDIILSNPSQTLEDDFAAELNEHFTPAELEELVLTASITCGFSKAAIAWGPPEEMDVIELPTPAPGNSAI